MTKNYIKRLRKLPPDFQATFIEIIDFIIKGEFENLDISKLQGRDGFFRCRVGKFRIVFHQDENGDFFIDDIGSRGDIYK